MVLLKPNPFGEFKFVMSKDLDSNQIVFFFLLILNYLVIVPRVISNVSACISLGQIKRIVMMVLGT